MEFWEKETQVRPQPQGVAPAPKADELVIEIGSRRSVPAGTYRVRITELKPEQGRFGPTLRVRFKVSTGPHAGADLLTWVDIQPGSKKSPKSRVAQLCRAALGTDGDIRAGTLIGRELMTVVEVSPSTNDPGTTWARPVAFLPLA